MAEAEDVLLEAAERVSAAARALWARRADPDAAAEARAAVGRRRLACWLVACFGRDFALTEVDAAPPPGWLARLWGKPAPWQRNPQPVASRDGDQILLPRHSLAQLGRSPALGPLLPALALGRRAAAESQAPPCSSAIARDVAWALEGARGDAALARMLPGLTDAIAAARRTALAARPERAALGPAERAVEELVRSLLREPVSGTSVRLARLLGSAPDPPRLRRFARDFARSLAGAGATSYRGLAPVLHWGAATEPGRRAQGPSRQGGERSPAARVPSRDLRRRIARRRPEPDESGSERGPFVLPASDPQLSVQDARGLDRPPDAGDEELEALAEALSRLPELPTLESEHAVREILDGGRGPRSARPAPLPSPGADEAAWVYPEWDHRSASYRARGCILREKTAATSDGGWAAHVQRERAALLRRLRRQFEALRPRRVRVGRRLDGDGLDCDGWVEEFAERAAGLAPAGRLYSQERPGRREVAVALLLDASGSTDAWVTKTQRVIDVAKEAALCFCEALASLGDRHALYAFSGCGPDDVRVWVPKRFDEPYGERARARLGALEPDRFTRLGGPIRHVTARLCRVPARIRLLLLLSDGKPNDEDAYEGEYGIEDARQALVEARTLGVRPFCITIDREGSSYLPRLFGPYGYTVLWDVEQLPFRLARIYRRLTAGAP